MSSTTLPGKDDVQSYYRYSNWLYKLFCYNHISLGMHHGFWEKTTKNRHVAMLNENRYIAVAGKIKKGMLVLDAGCGVGGSAIQIACEFQARVTGISNDTVQIRSAQINATKHHVNNLVDFQVQDYTHTTFPLAFFDVVYAIESVCHAYPKERFLREAYRLLKPSGRLVIADGYAAHNPKTTQERTIVTLFENAFAIPKLITGEKMSKEIEAAGFLNVRAISKLDQVAPSIGDLARFARSTRMLSSILSFVPNQYLSALERNNRALFTEEEAYHMGLAQYYVHTADKPK